MSGDKFDDDKLRMDLIPPEAIEALASVLTHGSKKYGDNNWMGGISYGRVYGAIQRHLQSYRKGEYYDAESGLPHLWHAFTELAFLIYFEENNYGKLFNTFQKEWADKIKIKEDK